MLTYDQYGFVKRAEHFWKGMSNDTSQISPIPPEAYGDRFVKFISSLTMTKEEQERTAESGEQLDGLIDTNRQPSLAMPRKSNENKVVEKAEKQAHKTEKGGAKEDPHHDRTLSSVRSPSADRSGGITGAILPVVEEDREASSREDSVQGEKPGSAIPDGGSHHEEPTPTTTKDQFQASVGKPKSDRQLLSLPNFNRLSMGLHSNSGQVSES